MSLLIIFLSYIIGCISIIAISICLYLWFRVYSRRAIVEQEQFQTSHPFSEKDHGKNSTIDTFNYFFQFLFQELKDIAKLRRYIVKKLTEEFEDIKKTQTGKLFVREISIQSFSLGKECPVFSDIQLERQERDERNLIKKVVTKLNLDYKDGFSMTLDIQLLFGYTCQLFIKVKRIQGHIRLEFLREPFSHWLAVFQDEPKIDIEIKSYLASREIPLLAHIIIHHARRIIRRKQTWPNYKIRYRPFFTSTKHPLPPEIFAPLDEKLIPGRVYISIRSCDRYSIPFDISNKEEYPLMISIDISEQNCEDDLCIPRERWMKKSFYFQPKLHRIDIREVEYLNQMEFLIEYLDPIPKEIEDQEAFRNALEDRNVFLVKIDDQRMQTMKQINRLIRGNDEQIQIVIGMPLLHVIRTRQTVKPSNTQIAEEVKQSTVKTKNSVIDQMTLVMMNNDLLPNVQVKRSSKHSQFEQREFEFQVSGDERYVNICLWCEPPSHSDVPNLNEKRVLLGYASAVLSDLVFDTQISFNRETETTLNFRSVYSNSRMNSETKLAELSRHKGYDHNITHGFVTIQVRHEPDILFNRSHDERREQSSSIETSMNGRDDEQLTTSIRSTDHQFEDKNFTEGTYCAYCHKKIWMKVGRECRDCAVAVHKKCDEKFNRETSCTREHFIQPKTIIADDERSFRRFSRRTVQQTTDSSLTESLRHEDWESSIDRRSTSNQPGHTSSKFVNAASSAYSKLRELKPKRPSAFKPKKTRSSIDLTGYENISEEVLQDIVIACLSDENTDSQSLNDLFHEKSVDNTAVYARANQLGPELFGDLSPEERREKIESEIFRLQQELELQNEIRDELIIECNSNLTDENAKRNIQAKLNNMQEKIQALITFTIFYCSSLKYCRSELEGKGDHSNENSKILDDSE